MSDWLLTVGDRDIPGGPQHVHGAQWLLTGHNHFGRAWYHGNIDGVYGEQTAAATKRCKYELGYEASAVRGDFGLLLFNLLTGKSRRTPAMLLRARQRQQKFIWPTSPHGTVIGWPGVGTHSFKFPPNNWESDNAWDIGVPFDSTVLAVADGTIGPEFGPLPDPDPRFHGIRLHLVTADNEFYYAHLHTTATGVKPGVKVHQGQTLGRSGIANSVAHLHIGVEHLLLLSDFK